MAPPALSISKPKELDLPVFSMLVLTLFPVQESFCTSPDPILLIDGPHPYSALTDILGAKKYSTPRKARICNPNPVPSFSDFNRFAI